MTPAEAVEFVMHYEARMMTLTVNEREYYGKAFADPHHGITFQEAMDALDRLVKQRIRDREENRRPYYARFDDILHSVQRSRDQKAGLTKRSTGDDTKGTLGPKDFNRAMAGIRGVLRSSNPAKAALEYVRELEEQQRKNSKDRAKAPPDIDNEAAETEERPDWQDEI